MPIGALHRPLTFVQQTKVSDGKGGWGTTWAPIQDLPIWGDVEGGTSQRVTTFAAIDSRVNSVITIRFRAGVNPGMRITDGDRTFLILGVVDQPATRHWLTLTCQEQLAQGTS